MNATPRHLARLLHTLVTVGMAVAGGLFLLIALMQPAAAQDEARLKQLVLYHCMKAYKETAPAATDAQARAICQKDPLLLHNPGNAPAAPAPRPSRARPAGDASRRAPAAPPSVGPIRGNVTVRTADGKHLETVQVPEGFGKVTETPIPGVYEVVLGNQILYYAPQPQITIVGELVDQAGRNLTQARRNALRLEKLAGLDLDDALTLGDGPVEVIEFTDPDCPYCRALNQAIPRAEVTRHIIFTPLDIHPGAAAKAEHVLCSENAERALAEAYGTAPAPAAWRECPEGKARLTRHQAIAKQFGVAGTPTLVIHDQVMTGYDQRQLFHLINQARETKEVRRNDSE